MGFSTGTGLYAGYFRKEEGGEKTGETCMDESFQTTPTPVLNIIHAIKNNLV